MKTPKARVQAYVDRNYPPEKYSEGLRKEAFEVVYKEFYGKQKDTTKSH